MNNTKHWDWVTKSLLGISISTIIFSFFAPYFFAKKILPPDIDFSNTGTIGDTIGGLMNPFIAIAGILITFLAFYMQIKANEIQIRQFKESFEIDKRKEEKINKTSFYYTLKLLLVDLGEISEDMKTRAYQIEAYYTALRERPLETSILFRTASTSYSRIKEVDRMTAFKGFSLFLNEGDWIKKFSALFNILDFLPEFFQDTYMIFDNHSSDIEKRKKEINDKIEVFLSKLTKVINRYKAETKELDNTSYLNFPASSLCNKTFAHYNAIIADGYLNNKETDLLKLRDDVAIFFISNALNLQSSENYDTELDEIILDASQIRIKITQIEKQSLGFSDEIQSQYNKLMKGSVSNKPYITTIIDIKDFIEDGLNKLTPEDF